MFTGLLMGSGEPALSYEDVASAIKKAIKDPFPVAGVTELPLPGAVTRDAMCS